MIGEVWAERTLQLCTWHLQAPKVYIYISLITNVCMDVIYKYNIINNKGQTIVLAIISCFKFNFLMSSILPNFAHVYCLMSVSFGYHKTF